MDRITLLIIFIFVIILQGCAKPNATVFEDNRLSEVDTAKFCLTGDMGRDTPHQQEIADALEKEDCDRIFFLGDLVYPKGISSVNDPLLQKNFLDYYLPIIDRDPGVIIGLVLGNHDHKGDPSAWKKVSKQYPGIFFPNYYYLIDYGGLCIVGLDTSFYYYAEKVVEAAEQAEWLFSIQSRLKDCKVKIALTHHPLKGDKHPGSKDWNGADGPLKLFLETYIVGKFDMHISGHVHILHDDGKDEGTRLLISGTGGEILGGGTPGYIVLRWEHQNPKRVGYSFRYVDTDVNIINDSLDPPPQEQQEEEESEYLIKKVKVGPGFFKKIIRILKKISGHFFNS
jgi:calcineurin-like phosphoesterase family protein